MDGNTPNKLGSRDGLGADITKLMPLSEIQRLTNTQLLLLSQTQQSFVAGNVLEVVSFVGFDRAPIVSGETRQTENISETVVVTVT